MLPRCAGTACAQDAVEPWRVCRELAGMCGAVRAAKNHRPVTMASRGALLNWRLPRWRDAPE